mmetsp:Transcript_61976/g.121730  ORF Transcript_61976/g.121730 Transcript_61976/m.121730 type:complete len:318 (-) Transcript_61976:509-1462(-)
MARHMEQPGSRQSKPASVRMVCRPSSSAWIFTRPDPGTTMAALMLGATFLPWATSAAARMSSMRALVQEPINTLSTGTSSSFSPPLNPMYFRLRSTAARLCGSLMSAGSGTKPVIALTSCGEVPQVKLGAMSAASICTSTSNLAPSSVLSAFQYSEACSNISPVGAMVRPLRYSKVTSSGAIMPARAPASMAMLHTDMRPSILSPATASPQNSTTHPVPPAVPMTPITWRIKSFEVTPASKGPFTCTRMFLALACTRVWVASTCSTSEVPMPNAKLPNAPCVAVWLSPQTMVMPGCVNPCSGPMMCTMPWRALSSPK